MSVLVRPLHKYRLSYYITLLTLSVFNSLTECTTGLMDGRCILTLSFNSKDLESNKKGSKQVENSKMIHSPRLNPGLIL